MMVRLRLGVKLRVIILMIMITYRVKIIYAQENLEDDSDNNEDEKEIENRMSMEIKIETKLDDESFYHSNEEEYISRNFLITLFFLFFLPWRAPITSKTSTLILQENDFEKFIEIIFWDMY